MAEFVFSIIGIILELIILVWLCVSIYKSYKSSSIPEKTLFWLLFLAVLYPLALLAIDKFNIASIIKWVDESNSERWFNYLGTYGSSLVSAIIGAIVLVLMTIFQIKRQDEKDAETMRINNIPLLIYEICQNKVRIDESNLLITNCKNGKLINFKLKIKNIGMNTVKKSFIVFSSKILDKDSYNWLQNKGCISKDDCISISRCLELPIGRNLINITLFYCDLIDNWYSQKVIVTVDISVSAKKVNYNMSLNVEDEELLSEVPKNLMRYL